jgi:hypothetical protein
MNHAHFNFLLLVSSLATLAGGCSSSTATLERKAKPSVVSIVPEARPTQEQSEHMLAAKDVLFSKLSARLMEVMSSDGPVAAITVCQQEAATIAKEVGEQEGLLIGRTGVRLRNPNNSAPAWASSLIQAKTATPTFVKLSNGHSAALLPIKLQGQCMMCHGPKEQIAPIILSQIMRTYPNDQATDFKEGELRGWFWIDLPNG